jgi:flagellar motor switch protein FliM
MNVKLPVRSVLAEPVIPLAQLMTLKPGDIIPISFGPEIPLLVSNNRFARGAVGASNGRAAIRVHRIEPLDDEDA